MKPHTRILSAISLAGLAFFSRNASTATWQLVSSQHLNTSYYGHLAEWGSSDSGTETSWTYAQYYGPPEQNTKGQTKSRLGTGGYTVWDNWTLAARTYIDTGRLWDKDTEDNAESWVSSDRVSESSGGDICSGLSQCVFCRAQVEYF
jgi:hypothetical protein